MQQAQRVRIDPAVFREHKDALVGVVLVHGFQNNVLEKNIHTFFVRAQEIVLENLALDKLASFPFYVSWRDAYKKFGAKPKEHLCSIENLTRRLLKSNSLRSINPLVDLYNSVSLLSQLPLGAEDLATVVGDIRLTVAGPQEEKVLLLGDKAEKAPTPGEIFYTDDKGAICRRWNWKEADRTKVTEQTTAAIIVVESLPPVSREYLEHTVLFLAQAIKALFGGNVSYEILDQNLPEVTLSESGSFLALRSVTGLLGQPRPFWLEHLDFHAAQAQEVVASQEHEIRLKKIALLREKGIEPWPLKVATTAVCAAAIEKYKKTGSSAPEVVAGRLMSKRDHGKSIFAQLQDRSGRLQVYFKQDLLGAESFEAVSHLLDVGDQIACKGALFTTKTGEPTLMVESWWLLAKCLHPLPEKFHGITDVEMRYRQRYLDIMMTPESRERFKKRSSIIRLIRAWLEEHDFIEVETPMLHSIPGGAAAKPFVTHHNALKTDLYLRIAPELYLKRLVIGGFERVYEINRNFRNEGISTRHNPEFTMLEFYQAHEDYHYSMNFVENMIRFLAQKVCDSLQVSFGEQVIDFSKPFRRFTAEQAIEHEAGIASEKLSASSIDKTLVEHGIGFQPSLSHAQKVFLLFEEVAEKKLIQPTFIIDFPVEISPLAKCDEKNPAIAARYELYIAGMEISNSYSELNNPFEQAERFKQQVAASAHDEEAHRYDAEYITALEYGLPPTVGVGIGIDRLTMILSNTTSIKDIILFPTLKRKE